MKTIVLGGDGFCGWPTALHLSDIGHEVLIIDNLSRRKIDMELGVSSLTPIQSIEQRIAIWESLSQKSISFKRCDIATDYSGLLDAINQFQPDNIVHFAEQRAAPYSMKTSETKRYTVDNNISATHNVLIAIVESGQNPHLIHLGTMGVYGYSSIGLKIPEGYLDVEIEVPNRGRMKQNILYPTNPGSVYHATKSLDQVLFAFYCKNNQLRITDLHQGIVWGTQTKLTSMHDGLINRFDYDGDYGTVLNRFLMQAAVNYPLTVHGTGGQTRAFIHIKDTVRCIELACNTPANGERVEIRNQVTETHRVRDLAKLVSNLSGTKVEFTKNPRKEDAENDLDVCNDSFIELGLNPTYLQEGLMEEIRDIAITYKDRADLSQIPCQSEW